MGLLETIKEKYQILIFSVINVVFTLAPVVNLLVREKYRIEVAVYIGATIVVGLTFFPFYYCCMSPTMVKLRGENVHAKTFGRTVYGCWVWLSFAGSTEMAVYSYMLEDHKYVAWIIAIVLQLVVHSHISL